MSFEELGKQMGELVDQKQVRYGNSFGEIYKILEILYPDGIRPEQYRDALGVIRVIDKLFRLSKGDQGSESAWADITGYGLLGMKFGSWREKQRKIKEDTNACACAYSNVCCGYHELISDSDTVCGGSEQEY